MRPKQKDSFSIISISKSPRPSPDDADTILYQYLLCMFSRSARMKVLALSYILAAAPGAFAFVTPTTQSQTVSKTQLFEYTPPTGFNPYAGIKDMPKGDEQRKLRRTVYSHDDWKKHRSQDRFLFYLAAAFSSGVYKNLGQEVALISSIATFVCIFNAVSGGYVDLNGVSHEALVSLPILGIPMDAFTLSSPPLGLLLGELRQSFVSLSASSQ